MLWSCVTLRLYYIDCFTVVSVCPILLVQFGDLVVAAAEIELPMVIIAINREPLTNDALSAMLPAWRVKQLLLAFELGAVLACLVSCLGVLVSVQVRADRATSSAGFVQIDLSLVDLNGGQAAVRQLIDVCLPDVQTDLIAGHLVHELFVRAVHFSFLAQLLMLRHDRRW